MQSLYLVFQGADVIGKVSLVLFQLSNFGLLVVDGCTVFVDKSLQKGTTAESQKKQLSNLTFMAAQKP